MADGIKARIGGVWKDLTPSIKVGGVWKTPDAVHIRVGGVWKEVWSGLSVQLPVISLAGYSEGWDAHSGIQFRSNGDIYKHPNSGDDIWIDTASDWLLDGSNSQVWISCVFTSGFGSPSLKSGSDLGDGTRLALTINRHWDITDTTADDGQVEATLLIKLYDAATGGNELASRTYSLDADTQSPF